MIDHTQLNWTVLLTIKKKTTTTLTKLLKKTLLKIFMYFISNQFENLNFIYLIKLIVNLLKIYIKRQGERKKNKKISINNCYY